MSRPLLIFGGTFDPPHRAHIELPRLIAHELDCERIIYVPAASNPLKKDQPTDDAHRLTMLQIALADVPEAEIDRIELERGGPSYTVDTLEHIRNRLASARGEDQVPPLRLLIGADNALSFQKWKDWQRILALATPVIMLRPPWNMDAFDRALKEEYAADKAKHWQSWIVDVPLMDINATDIRARLSSGQSVSGLLDPGVGAYIRKHNLYDAGAT